MRCGGHFASWLVAEGADPAYVMAQLGHTDPQMTLGLYAKALKSKRGRRARAARRAGAGSGTGSVGEWAPMGTVGVDLAAEDVPGVRRALRLNDRTPRHSAGSE